MRRAAAILLVLGACVSPDAPAPTSAVLHGTLSFPTDAGPGDAFVFLYAGNDGPLPRGSGRPVQLSSVPLARQFGGEGPDADFVFAQVDPGRYRLRGIVDARQTFDPYVDVLAQPFAGDADVGLTPVALSAGESARVGVSGGRVTQWDPPMFTVDSPSSGNVSMTSDSQGFTIMHVKVSALPFGDASRTAFLYGSADADHDGKLDDFNGDGQPDVYPEVVLQRIHRDDDGPEFSYPDGGPLTILLPAATVQPDPVGRDEQVATDVGTLRAVNGLYVLIPPIAVVAEGVDPSGKPLTRRLPAIPVGQYAITVVQATGQFWQVPNGLAPGGLFSNHHGGPYASQVARINVVPAR